MLKKVLLPTPALCCGRDTVTARRKSSFHLWLRTQRHKSATRSRVRDHLLGTSALLELMSLLFEVNGYPFRLLEAENSEMTLDILIVLIVCYSAVPMSYSISKELQ